MTDRQASIPEIVPLRTAAERYDVAILGGGLAGLTLAIQLKKQRPETRSSCSRSARARRRWPPSRSASRRFPSGAHYFAEVVGMRNHLEAAAPDQGRTPLLHAGGGQQRHHQADRARPPRATRPRTTTRSIAACSRTSWPRSARALGVDVLQGCRVQDVDFGSDQHTVKFTQAEADTSLQARWVVDAAGRASLLKRKLGLAKEVGHTINSAWIRLGGGLDLEQWGADNAEWMAEMPEPGFRQYSTNHLLGEGYWVWMIPLSSGPISIGVCADPRFHPFEEIDELDRMVGWLRRHEPPARRRDRAPARRDRGLPPGGGLRLRRRAGVLDRSLGSRGRGGRVRRPVLLTRLRLHRLRQHLHRRPHRPRPRGRGHRRAVRLLQRLLPAHIRPRALEVRGPVPDHGPPRGDDAEAHLRHVHQPLRPRC